MSPRSRRFGLCLVVLAVLILPSASADITAVIEPSRRDCVAPCAVFFEGTDSTDASGNSINSIGLVDSGLIKYLWDFDSDDTVDFEGFNAAYVYEPIFAPGETEKRFTVSLTVSDGQTTSAPDTETITVKNPDWYYGPEGPGITICRANSQTEDFSVYPECDGATLQPGRGDYSSIGSDTRILYKRGDTFTYTTKGTYIGSNITIGALGTCEQAGGTYDARDICSELPIIKYEGTSTNEGTSVTAINALGYGITAMDIKVDATSTAGKRADCYNNGNHFLILRSVCDNAFGNRLGLIDGALFMHNSVIEDSHLNPIYLLGSRISIINSKLGPSTSHNVYGSLIDSGVFHNTEFSATASRGTNLRIASNNGISRNVIVSSNIIDGTTNQFAIEITNTHRPAGPLPTENIVVEKNLIIAKNLRIQGDRNHIIIRNNIFEGGLIDHVPHVLTTNGPDHVRIFNNNLVNGGISFQTCGTTEQGCDPYNDIDIYNNIVTGGSINYDNTDEGVVETENNIFSDPGWKDPDNGDYHLTSQAITAIDQGYPLPYVLEDFDGNPRPSGTGWDIGAFEYQSGGGECSVNEDCDDANPCADDKCDSGACRYINYNLDNSDTMGLGDIIQIIAYWGGSNPDVDLNEDGNISLADVLVIISVWGAFC